MTNRTRGRPKAFHDKSQGAIIQSLDRALDVLKIVASGSGMSLTEIARAGDQSQATCYRILTTLSKHRIVEFDETSQLWHIGLEAFRIGMSFLGRTRLAERSRPVMQRIMNETGETANLAILDRSEVIFVSQIETHEPIRAFFRPGTRGPGHASGIGKAILAFLPEEQVRKLMAEDLPRFTDTTITAREDFMAELAEIRSRGFAVDNEERTEGMRCIAAPVFNAYGEAVAGVSLSGPSVRVRPGRDLEFGALIRRAADEITRSTGGILPVTA
ncbi:helix-turn-helix domain-containing protein [Stappia sp. GBMRC 2046]|uniref:Helix-turn-helix domain-containing protein n=1 Tax=Stappia sediminis TaxID=2692190 RepID=A0A7X3S955_9HYPH|nr:HTH-type transcriptional regulator BhcR [Stappia sediminis]MXN66523.1 helix-turn-helix domain-containing protein [Stappia sediminis]